MTYYRLIIKKDESGQLLVSDISEQTIGMNEFEKIKWDKPIIYHFANNHHHFCSLEKEYLVSFCDGLRMSEVIKRY
jgi:hypothetical protein